MTGEPTSANRRLSRWTRDHSVGLLTALALVGMIAAFQFRDWVARNPGVMTIWVTLALFWVTGWYASTTRKMAEQNSELLRSAHETAGETRRLARETEHLARETERLAATGSRGLLMESIPVLAVRDLSEIPFPHVTFQNVGQAAAIVTHVRVELARLGGTRQFLDSRGLGEELLNLGQGHEYAVAASETLQISLRPEGLVRFDGLHSACEVEYQDIVGNEFLARHEPGRSFTLAIRGQDGGWAAIEPGLAVDPETGRLRFPSSAQD
jgi:hypothetical protein